MGTFSKLFTGALTSTMSVKFWWRFSAPNASSNHFLGIFIEVGGTHDSATPLFFDEIWMIWGFTVGAGNPAVPVATMCKLLTKVSWTWNIYSGHVSESIHWLLVSTHLISQSNLNGMIGAHLTVWGWLITCKNMLYSSDDEHAWTPALLMWKPGNKSCNHNSMGPIWAKLNLLWLSFRALLGLLNAQTDRLCGSMVPHFSAIHR
jgi:hypothetical protein